MNTRSLLAVLLLCSTRAIFAAPQAETLMDYKTVGDSTLALHIFNPDHHDASHKAAAIVFFFGGGWNGGTPVQFYKQCEYLSPRPRNTKSGWKTWADAAICASMKVNPMGFSTQPDSGKRSRTLTYSSHPWVICQENRLWQPNRGRKLHI